MGIYRVAVVLFGMGEILGVVHSHYSRQLIVSFTNQLFLSSERMWEGCVLPEYLINFSGCGSRQEPLQHRSQLWTNRILNQLCLTDDILFSCINFWFRFLTLSAFKSENRKQNCNFTTCSIRFTLLMEIWNLKCTSLFYALSSTRFTLDVHTFLTAI